MYNEINIISFENSLNHTSLSRSNWQLNIPTNLIKKRYRANWVNPSNTQVLHGPSMFAVKAKIYEVIYNQSSAIAFDETSSYWSAPKSS